MKLITIASLLVLAVAVTSCANTIRGVGRDMKESAQAIDDATS